jgi:hypothetical protein
MLATRPLSRGEKPSGLAFLQRFDFSPVGQSRKLLGLSNSDLPTTYRSTGWAKFIYSRLPALRANCVTVVYPWARSRPAPNAVSGESEYMRYLVRIILRIREPGHTAAATRGWRCRRRSKRGQTGNRSCTRLRCCGPRKYSGHD